MSNITVIIPVVEFNEDVKRLLEKAIESVEKQETDNKPELLVVCSPEVADKLKGFNIMTSSSNDFQSFINEAVNTIKTEYFSILEYDDEYNLTYFGNVNKYTKALPDVDIFMTMIIDVDDEGRGIKTSNQAVWSQQFLGENGEFGYLNMDTLKGNSDFKLSGAVIKTSQFIEIGGYKKNIVMTYNFELLLRALNNTLNVFVIPKIGYKHLVTRFETYVKSFTLPERKFWFDTAIKEYIFNNDREIDTTKIVKIISE